MWQTAPALLLGCLTLLLAETAFGLAVLYCLKQLVDAATAQAGVAAAAAEAATLQAVLLAGLASLAYVLVRVASGLAGELFAQRVADRVDDLINERAAAVDLAFYESPLYHDLLARALAGGSSRPVRLILNQVQLVQNGLMLAALGALIVTVHWLLIPMLAISLLPGLAVRLYYARKLHAWTMRRTQLERLANYLRWLLTDRHHAKETRSFELGGFLRQRFSATRTQVRIERAGISWRRSSIEALVGTCTTVALFGALAFLVQRSLSSAGGIGDLVMFLMVFQRGQGVLQNLRGNVAGLYEDNLYLGNLFQFLDLRPAVVDPVEPLPLPPGAAAVLELQAVGFTYPGSAAAVLHGIEMRIAPGQVVALVGANGSGKTTLIKLLSRLYDPSCGQVSYGGIPIARFALADWRRMVSVVFQDYAQYSVSMADNIRYGDVRVAPGDPRIEQAAVLAHADQIAGRLGRGYDTVLGRTFDGSEEISQGQWQKVALARALVGTSRLIVLDEPTSALDPDAEYELFRDFRTVIEGRAALVISHRLSTVRQADYIYVMDQGRIVEHGNHDELMALKGKYRDLFEKQAYNYR